MISNKKQLKEWIAYERERYGCSSEIKEFIKYILGGERATIWQIQKCLRYTEYYYNSGRKIRYGLSLFRLNHLRNKYGIHIGINVCDKGLKIMHLGSILTNGNVKIGKDCALHINTSFVAQGASSGAPQLGDGVVAGVGSVVLGVYVANNVAIGANALVNKSVEEENIAIAGVPAKKISNNGRLEWNKK